MTAPRFTVLMPTHYRADVIGYAIRSVLAQTEPDFELLVVGDGAQPGTAEAVKAFDDPRIRWFDLPKAPGYGYANRNIALADSVGRLIAYAADDDIMLPDHLERLGEALDDPAAQWAYSQVLWVSTDGIAAPELTNLDLPDERDFLLKQHNTISGGAMVFRAGAFPSRRCWPEDAPRAGDWQMMKALFARHGAGAMRRVPVPTLLHFAAGTKTRRDSSSGILRGWLEVADHAAWWPDSMRLGAPAGPPQAAYFDRLADPAYLPHLRADAADMVNRMALDHLEQRVRPIVPRTLELWRWWLAEANRTLRRMAKRLLRR